MLLIRAKTKRGKHPLKQCIFDGIGDVALCELGSEQIQQVIGESLVFHLYTKRDALIFEYLLTIFPYCCSPVTVVNAGRCVQLILENNAHRIHSLYNSTSTPTKLEVLLVLHSLYVLHEAVKLRTLKVAQPCAAWTLIGYCAQLATKEWSQLLYSSCVNGFKFAPAPYMWYNERKARFVVFSEPFNALTSP